MYEYRLYGLKVKSDIEFKQLVKHTDGMPDKKDVEERLWVIIPWSVEIRTTAQKIAGRYPEEAILEMKLGDTVTVSKGSDAVETYMVVQGDNELFLVKKKR